MAAWKNIEAFWRAFRSGAGGSRPRHAGDSLARALKDSTHVRGGQMGMGLGRAGTEQQHEIVAEGHEHYEKSFADDD